MTRLDLLFKTYALLARVSRHRGLHWTKKNVGQTYSLALIAKLFLAISWSGWSIHIFFQKLALEGPALRRRLRLPKKLPSYSQFQKRLKDPSLTKFLQTLLQHSARDTLKRLGPDETRVLMMDLTNVPSTRTDSKAHRGFDGTDWFWGYKLGIITSQSGIVLGAWVVNGNYTETRCRTPLIRQAHQTLRGFSVRFLVCDCGFNGHQTYRIAHELLHCRVLMPSRRKIQRKRKGPNHWLYEMRRRSPHRFRDYQFWKTPLAKKIYNSRKDIERRLSQLTDDPFNVDRRPRNTIGSRTVLRYEFSKLILWNQALNENILNHRKMRKVKLYVA